VEDEELGLNLVHLQIARIGGHQRREIMTSQCADGGVGQQAIELRLGAALKVSDRLGKGQWVSDPPDHEGARDDVLLVAREHFRLTGLVDSRRMSSNECRIDGPWQLPVQPGLSSGAQWTSETGDMSTACPSPTTTAARLEENGG
jgi:hypothetical protein